MTDITARNTELREMLTERRCEILGEVHSRIGDRRTDRQKDVVDDIESADASQRLALPRLMKAIWTDQAIPDA